MGKTTKNLSRSEFRCRCGCGLQDPHPVLVVAGQELIDLADSSDINEKISLIITGGGRCQASNLAVGGAVNSQHLPDIEGYTKAIDCSLFIGNRKMPLKRQFELACLVMPFFRGGIGLYCDDQSGPRMHLDVRTNGPARWGMINRKTATLDEVLAAAETWEAAHKEA